MREKRKRYNTRERERDFRIFSKLELTWEHKIWVFIFIYFYLMWRYSLAVNVVGKFIFYYSVGHIRFFHLRDNGRNQIDTTLKS